MNNAFGLMMHVVRAEAQLAEKRGSVVLMVISAEEI